MAALERFTVGAAELWRAAVELVYPRNCQLCHTPLTDVEQGAVCRACTGKVRFIEPPFCARCALPFAGEPKETYACGYCADLDFPFSRAVAACAATGVARDVIHRFKYNGEMYFLPHLEEWLTGAAWRWIDWEMVDVILPVPLHPRKERHRGFNQALLLARALGQSVQRPVAGQALRRVRDTRTQTRLSARDRTDNLHEAFAVREPAALAGKRAVLVDDVFTTGATLASCARVMRIAGAAEVTALTVARGI